MSFHILFLDYKISLKLILLDDTEKKNWFESIFFFKTTKEKNKETYYQTVRRIFKTRWSSQHFDGLSNKRYTTVAQFRLNSRINEVLWILAHWLCQWCFISLLVDYKLHYEKSQRLRRRPMVTWPQGLSMYDVMKREGTWKWKVIKREKKKNFNPPKNCSYNV